MRKGLWALALAAALVPCGWADGAQPQQTERAGQPEQPEQAEQAAQAGQAGQAGQAEPRPTQEAPAPDPFDQVPAQWRDYYRQAAEAERIEDRLQRCLAFPDLPGNRWPPGHAAAHCRYHALAPIPLPEFEAALAEGRVATLDARLDALLARHFAGPDGEDIHVAMESFDHSGDADRVSARWLELAPRSAHAHLARASHLASAAWEARGGAWASDTPPGNLRRMQELMGRALPLYREAIRLDPRLMPAYAGLIDLAKATSRDDVAREALAAAMAQDPACVDVARAHMAALQPRWGGSYPEMLEFAARLSRHLARRPQLAIHVAAPYGDAGDRLRGEAAFTLETMAVLDVATRTGSNESHLHGSAVVALGLKEDEGGPDEWKAVAMLLQEHRFNAINAASHQTIARVVLPLAPAWGMGHATRAFELAPDELLMRYTLATAYRLNGQPEQAEVHYLVAAQGEPRAGVLREIAVMWLYHSGLAPAEAAAKGKPHIDRLLAEFPGDGFAWRMRLDQLGMAGEDIPMETIRSLLRHADRNDPWQADAAARIEAEMERVGAPPETWRP